MSVHSVYKALGNKPALLKTVFDVAIASDDEAEPDPRRNLSLYGEVVADVSPRPIQPLVRAAAATNPEAGVWEPAAGGTPGRHDQFARALHQQRHLRPAVSVDEARDMLWTCSRRSHRAAVPRRQVPPVPVKEYRILTPAEFDPLYESCR